MFNRRKNLIWLNPVSVAMAFTILFLACFTPETLVYAHAPQSLNRTQLAVEQELAHAAINPDPEIF